MRKSSRLSWILHSPVAAALLASLFIAVFTWPRMAVTPDGFWYRRIADGHLDAVDSPFAKRVLHPLFAYALTRLTGLTVDMCFRALAVLALIGFSLAIAYLLRQQRAGTVWIFPILLSSAGFQLFSDYYVHDLFYASLLAIYFIAIRSQRLASIPLLIAMCLTRESTSLLIGALLISLWPFGTKTKPIFVKLTVFGTLVGMALSAYVSSLGRPNIHHLPEIVYYGLKIPNNIAYNLMGIVFWTNTQTVNHCVPVWKVPIPSGTLGAIREAGVCGVSPAVPLRTVLTFLTEFGVLPCVLVYAGLRSRTRLWRHGEFVVRCAVWYGLMSAVASIVGGNAPYRYLTYCWPLFVLVLPRMVQLTGQRETKLAIELTLWSVALGLCGAASQSSTAALIGIIGVAASGHVVTWTRMNTAYSMASDGGLLDTSNADYQCSTS